jgi:cytochrome bd-type quinol oxidase subunit 2
MALTTLGHVPPLFGVGGTVIVLCFLGIAWLWAKERATLEGTAATSADFKLVGYVLFFIAAWFTCGAASGPFMRAFQDVTPMTPIYIMVCLATGWLFLFLSHYKAANPKGSAEVQ